MKSVHRCCICVREEEERTTRETPGEPRSEASPRVTPSPEVQFRDSLLVSLRSKVKRENVSAAGTLRSLSEAEPGTSQWQLANGSNHKTTGTFTVSAKFI